MAKKKRATWTRTEAGSKITLCHFPAVRLFVSRNTRTGQWAWRVMVSHEGVALGAGEPSQPAAEAAAIKKVKALLGEIERACP